MITFASPVSGFSVLVVNGDVAESYTVSDNLGDSVTKSLASSVDLGAATFSMSGHSLTSVDITSADVNAWSFAIDNVTFAAATSVPEPGLLLPMGVALVLLFAFRRKHLSAWLRN